MSAALSILAWTLVLAFVQIVLTFLAKSGQYGLKWAFSSRDEAVADPSKLAGRLERAQDNLFQSLPIFIGAVLIGHAAGRDGGMAAMGAQLFFWGRLIYLPLYAFGVMYARTVAWALSVVGLVMVLVNILGAFPMPGG